jgi:hypothetical protein
MTVDATISAILGLNERSSFAVLVGISLPFRLDMLSNLIGLVKNHEAQAELSIIIAEIRILQPERNFVLHAVWMGEGKTMHGHMFKNNKAKVRQEKWGAKEIGAIADRINAVTGRLAGCYRNIELSTKPA